MVHPTWRNRFVAMNGNSITDLTSFTNSAICRDDGYFVSPFTKPSTDSLNMVFNASLRRWIALCHLDDVHRTYYEYTFSGLIVSEIRK